MGNNSTRESRPSDAFVTAPPSGSRPGGPFSGPTGHGDGSGLGPQIHVSRSGRLIGPDGHIISGRSGIVERDGQMVEARRETRVEREARKLEKERIAREKERERSVREEHVDGGFLVTLGTYTGPEDFSKPIVRQLMIERRLAPFWKGLNDHSDSWTEYQLVAAAKGLPIPAADEPPSEELRAESSPQPSETTSTQRAIPITQRTSSANQDITGNLSPSHPAFSPGSTGNASSPPNPASPLFRKQAKTIASLTTPSRNASSSELVPQETRLPHDPHVHGQRLEAFLYKDASECPICFLYYPPYLNKTRCCDQPICSECFVQIKRPDPHPPEHADPNNPNPSPQPAPGDEDLLVSEPAACPFCVQPEFGVTYEPPPFRRGLIHAHQSNSLAPAAPAMSSSSSLNSQGLTSPGGGNRRRTTSLSATAAQVITTDRVRPDWAKKLSDARAHALRRSAAATALHNAAYAMGGLGPEGRGIGFGRRRRLLSGESPTSSGNHTPRGQDMYVPMGTHMRTPEGGPDSGSVRNTSRRHRVEDLEELMMMEAIRLSLAAEEDRKRKEDKEAAKEAKKEEKRKAKELKKVGKAQRNIARGFHPIDVPGDGSNTGGPGPADGKGKNVARASRKMGTATDPAGGDNDGDEAHASSTPSSSEVSLSGSANSTPAPARDATARNGADHDDASYDDQNDGPSEQPDAFAPGTPSTTNSDLEPMLNFRSLAAIIDTGENENEKSAEGPGSSHAEHTENIATLPRSSSQGPSSGDAIDSADAERGFEDNTLTPKATNGDPDETRAATAGSQQPQRGRDDKGRGDVSVVDTGHALQQ